MPDPSVPRRLGEYELLNRLGGSQTGPVFQARHAATGRMFAIKVLPAELAAQETVFKRFEREAALAANAPAHAAVDEDVATGVPTPNRPKSPALYNLRHDGSHGRKRV